MYQSTYFDVWTTVSNEFSVTTIAIMVRTIQMLNKFTSTQLLHKKLQKS